MITCLTFKLRSLRIAWTENPEEHRTQRTQSIHAYKPNIGQKYVCLHGCINDRPYCSVCFPTPQEKCRNQSASQNKIPNSKRFGTLQAATFMAESTQTQNRMIYSDCKAAPETLQRYFHGGNSFFNKIKTLTFMPSCFGHQTRLQWTTNHG